MLKLMILLFCEYCPQNLNCLSAATAKAQFADMLKNGNLLRIFGDEIAGIPIEIVLAMAQAEIGGIGAIL